jgi:signal transduction histidine kinase
VNARAPVWPSLEALRRAMARIYPDVTIDLAGERDVDFLGERQDFEEMAGNLIDNAAKYGGGRVHVGVSADGDDAFVVSVEDDGPGIAAAERGRLFGRGARLDTGKPGTGLGLAIARDVAEIYRGSVTLDASDRLGGLRVRLRLPRAGG